MTDEAVTAVLGSCETLEDEYWYHVSPQSDLPLAPGEIPTQDLDVILEFVEEASSVGDTGSFVDFVSEQLANASESLGPLRLLAGLSDKRLYLDLSYSCSREVLPDRAEATLCGCLPHELTRHSTSFFERRLASEDKTLAEAVGLHIAGYLVQSGLAENVKALRSVAAASRRDLLRALMLPKEAQQNEAKRRGHGAEAALAQILQMLGVAFIPPDKVENPIGAADPNFDPRTFQVVDRAPGTTFSMDLGLVNQDEELRVVLQALVQSSDPGQFGVNKSDETVELRRLTDEFNSRDPERRELWGLVDGVGYSENKSGTVNKMLGAFHEFIQLRSLFKVGLACHRMGLATVHAIEFSSDCYSERCIEQMAERYLPQDVPMTTPEERPENVTVIEAGWATLLV